MMSKRSPYRVLAASYVAIGCGVRQPSQGNPAPIDGGTRDGSADVRDAEPPFDSIAGSSDARDAEPPFDSMEGKRPVALATGQLLPNCLTVDAAHVYWTTSDGNVMSVPIAGGEPTVLASAQGFPFGIAVDATNVYWIRTSASAGMVMSAPIAGGTPRVLAANQRDPMRITVDGESLYWTRQSAGSVVRMPKHGGTVMEIATQQGSVTAIAVGGRAVYWAAFGDEALRWLPEDGEIATIATNAHAVSLSVVGTTVYWADVLLHDDGAAIYRLDEGRARIELARSPSPSAAVADQRHVYWSDFDAGAILRVPIEGGEATVIATGQVGPAEIAIDANSVYWINADSIMKLAK